jgi:hypothetical protein
MMGESDNVRGTARRRGVIFASFERDFSAKPRPQSQMALRIAG